MNDIGLKSLNILKIINAFLSSSTHCDAAESWQLGLQDPASPIFEGMIFFHNYLVFFLILIASLVFWLLYITISSFNSYVNLKKSEIFTHSSVLEIAWTLLPSVVLLIIAAPSFSLLYSLDESINPIITIKVVGHQWYWSYEYSDYATLDNGGSLNFDSYMVSTNDLVKGSFRLLEVDNRILVPINTHIRILVTAADVLHSWAIPSFGIKVDACPGRLSQASLFLKREGVFYGQCSEICGVNHGFMPIVVKGVSTDDYTSWLTKKLASI